VTCAEYRTARLSGDTGPELDAHLAGCVACTAIAAEVDEASDLLAAPTTWADPSADLEDRIVAAVVEAATVAGLTPGGDGAAAPDPTAEPPPILRVAEAPSSPRRGWLAWVAAAAVAALIAIPVLRANEPDWELTLYGEGPSPEATATVVGWATDAGTRMRINAVDLPVAPAGYVYEMWLSNGDIHLSAGSFRAADGVDLWIGVSRADFPRVWVTLEPVDADASVNGETVLDLET